MKFWMLKCSSIAFFRNIEYDMPSASSVILVVHYRKYNDNWSNHILLYPAINQYDRGIHVNEMVIGGIYYILSYSYLGDKKNLQNETDIKLPGNYAAQRMKQQEQKADLGLM